MKVYTQKNWEAWATDRLFDKIYTGLWVMVWFMLITGLSTMLILLWIIEG